MDESKKWFDQQKGSLILSTDLHRKEAPNIYGWGGGGGWRENTNEYKKNSTLL